MTDMTTVAIRVLVITLLVNASLAATVLAVMSPASGVIVALVILAVIVSSIGAGLAARYASTRATGSNDRSNDGNKPVSFSNGDEALMMERMASLLAHDLCNALSAIKINLQILSRPVKRSVEPADTKRCLAALDQVAQIEKIITDLQTFARPGQFEISSVDSREVVSAALLNCLSRIEAKDIEVARREATRLPCIRGDRAKLVLVLQQLIDNAVDASSAEGKISLRVVACDGPADDAGVAIHVEDAGCGMAPAVLARAKEAFFTTKARGTGLGLAIADRVVAKHGGSITLASVEGAGTTASTILPGESTAA
jgi:signal transduction histidine kinase